LFLASTYPGLLAEDMVLVNKIGERWWEAEVYDWFTEGFDPAALRAAKALLEDL
jgi:hypothetical protein